ncbi:CotH kinase family protein, partial [Flavobacteriaceae bacterium]|nr:CotH kinase family protein [Flavobacteriaceae bacterium]
MILKEKSNRSRAFKDVLYFLKTRAKLKIFFILSVCVLISLSLVSFGIFLNRNKKIDSIVHLGADLLENKFDFIGNYFSSFNSNSNLFILDIKFKHLDKINKLLNIANDTGYITEVLKTEEFPAKITFADKKYKVKLSLTGQYLDHVESERNSFNVEVKDDQTIMGMSKFKLLIPSTRGYLADWVAHEMQKNEGLIVPRFDFVTIKINGESKGVFSIEESYNTDLIENNNLRDGIIFKPGLNDIVVLNKKKINKDVNLKNRVNSLKNLWQSFLNNEISPEKIFDLEKFAIDYATTDLLSGLHSKHLLNLRYYYNPITNLIEPISREFGFMRNGYALNGKDKTKIFIKSLFENSELSEADKKFHKKIFKSLTFQKIYLKSLDRISNKSYLDSFFKSIKKEMYEKEKIIYNKTPFYSYPKRFLYENQKIIKNFLNPTDQVVFGDLLINNNKLSLKFTNKSFFPVKINYIIINDSIISRPLLNEYIVASSYSESHIADFDFLNDSKTIIENVNFFYNILGLDS